jgi:hypothetical protein
MLFYDTRQSDNVPQPSSSNHGQGLDFACRPRARWIHCSLDSMDAAIASIVRQIAGFDDVNTSANTIKNGAERILTRTRLMRERMEKELDILANEIQGLRRE